jgi:Ca2+/Na+ antiporter
MSQTANLPAMTKNMWTNGSCVATPGNWTNWESDLEANCCPGGMLGLVLGSTDVYRSPVICVIWLIILGWIFMGVALGAEIFMTAIEVVTSKESKRTGKDGKVYHVKVWNATVANLTLMALGSSAPEILLSVIELLNEGMNAGDLGPSTIVGSAAFNLMIITAVCIVCIPKGETRSLKQLGVFLVTATYSVVAYVWLLIIVLASSPEVITITEGVLTCVLLFMLIAMAYYADIKSTAAHKKKIIGTMGPAGSVAVNKADAAAAAKAAGLPKDATPQEIHDALAEELLPPKSRLHYRKQAMAGVAGTAPGTKVAPAGDAMGDIAMDGGRAKRVDPTEASLAVDPEKSGMIKWALPAVDVMESGGSVVVEAERVGGSKGEVSCSYSTKNQKAVAGKDYEEKSGEFSWADGEVGKKSVEIKVFDDDEFEKDEDFTVVLSDPKGGAAFPLHTDGGEDTEICTVTIVNDDDRATKLVEAIRMLRLDADSLDLAGDDWGQALKDAIFPPPGGGVKGKFVHFLMCPWKLLFAILPPPGLCGGWPCFFGALVGIGFQVVLISDFATQVGCLMYIKNTVTAITFVALGTSLPDTFASMQAAKDDKYADNSIGNVTGSNSVNVFFGLGVPWLIGAIYWAASGQNAAWEERFNPVFGSKPLPVPLYNRLVAEGGGHFVVQSGDLGLSVIVFTCCALITIGLILLRRKLGNQELGGNRTGAMASAALLVVLWLIYIVVSCLATYGFIVVKF